MDQESQAGKPGLDYISSKNMGTIIMEPLRGGGLTDNIPSDIQAIWDSAEVKKSPAEWALRFLWDQPEINVVLSGMSTMEQVIENVKIAEDAHANSLTDKERNLIQEVREAYNSKIHVDCTACGYCMSCPNGVDIPKNLNILNEYYIYQNMGISAQTYSFLTAMNSSASSCDECGECEEKCTQNIPIRKYLKEVQEIFDKDKNPT